MDVATLHPHPMRHRSLPRLRWPHFFVWPAWPPLLVLGLSVIASVTLIGACMAMLSPEAEAVGRWADPVPGAATRWAVLRSVSKGLGPDMRLAFVACDAGTAARLRTRLAPGMSWVSRILQAVVAACLGSPEVQRQIAAARAGYAARRAELHGELTAQGIQLPPPADGLNVWIPLDREARDVAYALAKRGWLVRLGSAYDVQAHTQAIRITVSNMRDGQARQFALDLKSALR